MISLVFIPELGVDNHEGIGRAEKEGGKPVAEKKELNRQAFTLRVIWCKGRPALDRGLRGLPEVAGVSRAVLRQSPATLGRTSPPLHPTQAPPSPGPGRSGEAWRGVAWWGAAC